MVALNETEFDDGDIGFKGLAVKRADVTKAVVSYGGGDDGSELVVGFLLEAVVKDGEGNVSKWTTCKRYSDYRRFMKKVRRYVPGGFPGRHFFKATNRSKKMVEDRRTGLSRFIKDVASTTTTNPRCLKEFLKFMGPGQADVGFSCKCQETLPGQPSKFIHSTWVPPKGCQKLGNLVIKIPWAVSDPLEDHMVVRSHRNGQISKMRSDLFSSLLQWVVDANDKIPTNKETLLFLKSRKTPQTSRVPSIARAPSLPHFILTDTTPFTYTLPEGGTFSITLDPTPEGEPPSELPDDEHETSLPVSPKLNVDVMRSSKRD